MFSTIAKWIFSSTAIAPVALTYGWVAFQKGENVLTGISFIITIILVFFCKCLMKYARSNNERMKFSIVSVEAADRENMAFLLLYLLPLFTAQFDALNWEIWVPAILIFATVIATGYSYHFNPLLGILGWHFYKVATKEGITYVLITKKYLQNTLENIEVVQLTEYMVLDLGEK